MLYNQYELCYNIIVKKIRTKTKKEMPKHHLSQISYMLKEKIENKNNTTYNRFSVNKCKTRKIEQLCFWGAYKRYCEMLAINGGVLQGWSPATDDGRPKKKRKWKRYLKKLQKTLIK